MLDKDVKNKNFLIYFFSICNFLQFFSSELSPIIKNFDGEINVTSEEEVSSESKVQPSNQQVTLFWLCSFLNFKYPPPFRRPSVSVEYRQQRMV